MAANSTMALDEEQSSAAHEMRRAIDCLRDCAALAEVDPETLEVLAAGVVHFSLPAGSLLFESGSTPDAVYLLASGRLGVKTLGQVRLTAEIEHGELVGEAGWLLQEQRSASVFALRDSELLLLPMPLLDAIAAQSTRFSLALARLCARRLRRSNRPEVAQTRARVFAIVPNSVEVDVANLATRLVAEFARAGRTELVWDARASSHTAAWFNRIEELNDYVVYVADPSASGWTRQCCRQAEVILLAAPAGARVQPWPSGIAETALARGARIELALLHDERIEAGAAARWLRATPAAMHHHIVDTADFARIARLLTRRGVGLVLSGGGARGFAHLGLIQALREARVPIDFIGGVSIGSIIAAGVAMGWSDEEMRVRYRRSFVDTNPVNDYTFPFVALTRGRKVSRLLQREYGDVLIEDLRLPFFCVSANLTTGRSLEHREGRLADALRASVAIPGVMPPVYLGDDVLVDGAAINNLPVDIMQTHVPGFVIGSDVGADRYALGRRGKRRINIFQILMHTGMVNSSSSAAAQRELADVLFKPPLVNIDLLNWRAFDRAIQAGYEFARTALESLPQVPRLPAAVQRSSRHSLMAELEKRLAAMI
ncbi:MAG TPA: patatin-like phospholipase family protein [Steroidobacteraceae bacterium]|nr:patatin-like phospholipase family protein [Steroidobacteraceae bacterium]